MGGRTETEARGEGPDEGPTGGGAEKLLPVDGGCWLDDGPFEGPAADLGASPNADRSSTQEKFAKLILTCVLTFPTPSSLIFLIPCAIGLFPGEMARFIGMPLFDFSGSISINFTSNIFI
ncbi:hypothetical protein WR25_02537 [Diploscapter pachys]|uniref:Uncharacterized protein n=1 Tax=Diploscapter pachys TaxID=2018661 RepID=A0A2A2KU63_9BILA|nr:hypothetical protein WR25_02537 [Diploscapter pachys]